MTNIPQLDTPRRMGRNAIKPDRLMKQFTHWLDPNEVARMQAFVGKQKVSEYVREAIAQRLEKDRAPPFDPLTMPIPETKKRKPKTPEAK